MDPDIRDQLCCIRKVSSLRVESSFVIPFPQCAVRSCRMLRSAPLQHQAHSPKLDDETWFLYICITIGLVCIAGIMSGLTLGLMSLDAVDLEVLRRSGSTKEKRYAAKIAPLLESPHKLLVSLLLCNAAATEALPLYIDRLTNPATAVLVSVAILLIFGEILPQAACSNHGLMLGAAFAPLVRVLIFVTAPIAWPIAWLLDQMLGNKESALFRRGQLKALVDIHASGNIFGGNLSADEVAIMKGALDLTSKTAAHAMTPLDLVFMLSSDAVLDEETLTALIASGHSRVPVHSPDDRKNILGILLVKELLLIDPRAGVQVKDLKVRSLPHLPAETPMWDMLKLFEIGRSHMAVLTRPTEKSLELQRLAELAAAAAEKASMIDIDSDLEDTDPDDYAPMSLDYSAWDPSQTEIVAIGIITIEDVLEELLQQEIVDETDQYVDNLHKDRVDAALLARTLPPHLQRVLNSRALLPRIGPAGGFMEQRSGWKTDQNDTGIGPSEPPPPPPQLHLHAQSPIERASAASLARHLAKKDPSRHEAATQPRRDHNFRQVVEKEIDSLRPLLEKQHSFTNKG